jgi:serine/threonine protein kinase
MSYDEDNKAAAEKELNALRSYNHPLILKLVDIVKDSHEFVYIILKKCEQSLEDALTKGPTMNEDIILRTITMVGLSVSYIHQLGTVHRDIKPQNILVDSIGGKKIYILADFGISH